MQAEGIYDPGGSIDKADHGETHWNLAGVFPANDFTLAGHEAGQGRGGEGGGGQGTRHGQSRVPSKRAGSNEMKLRREVVGEEG